MTDRCSVYGITADQLAKPWGALLVHTVRLQRRKNPVITWAICLRCEREERNQ